MNPVIHAHQVRKHYGAHLALDGVSFDIPSGRIVGVLGPNGAGKTTLIQSLLGLQPAEGEIRVLGQDPRRARHRLMEDVCFIADVAILPRWLKVSDAIRLVEGLHPKFQRSTCEVFLARTAIPLSAKVKQLSKGMVVQLHLALILAIDARVLVLDEPTLGLDVLYRKAFYRTLLEEYCDAERTLIISTHQIEEIESILTDVLLLKDGQIRLQASVEALTTRFYQLQLAPGVDPASARALQPMAERTVLGQRFFWYDGVPLDRLTPFGPVQSTALSDLFVHLLGESA